MFKHYTKHSLIYILTLSSIEYIRKKLNAFLTLSLKESFGYNNYLVGVTGA